MTIKCCDLTAGKLRTPVVFQQAQKTQTGLGATVAWVPVLTTRAHVRPVSGTERYRADRLEATTQVRIFIRYTDLITTADRVTYKGKALQIRAIINLEERDKWLEIFAEDGVLT